MMQDKVKIEVLDLTVDSDEEKEIKLEPLTPTKEDNGSSYSEPGESSGLQKSPSGRLVRNSDKNLDKAIAEIKKGQSLVAVASQYGIPQEVLYSKLVSRSLPKETEILTKAEEMGLVKWIVKSNNNNNLIFKHQLMERVGRLRKILNITPIFAKSKFGRMWYDYFMKSHPEIYENDGLLMPCDRVLSRSIVQVETNKKQVSTPDPEDLNILTPAEEDILVEWIISSNKNNGLVFKYQLMKRVGKMSKIAKSTPGFRRSKFGRLWYEEFLRKHPEIYENDELLLPSDHVTYEMSNQWPDEEDIKRAQKTFETSTNTKSYNFKHPTAVLLSRGFKDAIVVLHDFRKEKNLPYKLIRKNVFIHQASENDLEDTEDKENSESKDICTGESSYDIADEPVKESEEYSSNEEDVPFKPYSNFKGKRRKYKMRKDKPVCKECSRTFSSFAKLRRHVACIHEPGLNPVMCTHCNKTFSHKINLTVHMKHNHFSVRTFHECEECGKKFKFKTSMRKHQRTVHEGLDNSDLYICNICEKGFKYKNSLEAHIIYGHMKEKKKYSCNICQKTFIKHSLMLRHKTRHSKIKPMACLYCSKTFSRKYILREHLEYCGKTQKVKSSSREDCCA